MDHPDLEFTRSCTVCWVLSKEYSIVLSSGLSQPNKSESPVTLGLFCSILLDAGSSAIPINIAEGVHGQSLLPRGINVMV